MPARGANGEKAQIRTMYELRRYIRFVGQADCVWLKHFDEDELQTAIQTRDQWGRALPEVGSNAKFFTDKGGEVSGVVTLAMATLYSGKVEVKLDRWRWVGPLEELVA